MKVQVLVATMNQEDFSLLEKLNIHSDVIVGNQCNKNEVIDFIYKGNAVKWLSFNERGVGLNRNNALMRANADICLISDDDMVYVDDYVKIVKDAFERYPKADVLVFNLKEDRPTRYVIKKAHKVGCLNYLRYGTARIAFKLDAIRINGILFNLCFGGGTEHCHGEDNLFLTDCLKKGLKIYAVPETIAELTEERESSWNKGYDEKYLKDQGTLYRQISKRWWKFLCLQDAIRHKNLYEISWYKAFWLMCDGGELQ